MSLVSVVVPVYHNARSLPELTERLGALADRNPEDSFEFVFVDDGSRDDSFEVLQSLLAEDQRVRIVKLSRNFGSTPAIIAGLNAASGDAVAAIAADLQDSPTPVRVPIWWLVLDDAQQQTLVDRLSGQSGLCVVENRRVIDMRSQGRQVPGTPLVDFIGRSFEHQGFYGDYELLVRATP